MSNEVLAEITPSAGRRIMAIGMLLLLGAVLIYVALSSAAVGFGLQVLFLVCGVGALALCGLVRRATRHSIRLTEAGLFDSGGRTLCTLPQIAGVERGAFAFKPSNGFALRLKARAPRAWAPGVWWRFGRRLGVGGVTSSSQAKFMADMIAMRLAGYDMPSFPVDPEND